MPWENSDSGDDPVRWDHETGASSVEYALLGSLIAAVIAGTVLVLGQEVLDLFTFPWP